MIFDDKKFRNGILEAKDDKGYLPISYAINHGAKLEVNSNHTGKVNIGLRPEDFTVNENGPIKLKVELVELIGANTLIHGKLENSDEVLVASIAGVLNENKIGKNINLFFPNDKLHLFDTNTDFLPVSTP